MSNKKRVNKQAAVISSEESGIIKSLKDVLNSTHYSLQQIAGCSAEARFDLFYNPEPLLLAHIDFNKVNDSGKDLFIRILMGKETKKSITKKTGYNSVKAFISSLDNFQLNHIKKIVGEI